MRCYERLVWTEDQLKRLGMQQLTSGRSIYPWPWEILVKVRSWMSAYQGHLDHASSVQLWLRILSRFKWLLEYFLVDNGKIKFRLPSPRFAKNVYQQEKWFLRLFKNHIVMIQIGTHWEMVGKLVMPTHLAVWIGKRFPQIYLEKRMNTLLWESGLPIAWIGETGRSITTIKERVVICRWEGMIKNEVESVL